MLQSNQHKSLIIDSYLNLLFLLYNKYCNKNPESCMFCPQVGDRVVALPEWRAWSELVSVPAKNVFAIPDGLNYVDAAALATNYIVAYVLLFELGAVKPGSSLILHSAGGGVVSA